MVSGGQVIIKEIVMSLVRIWVRASLVVIAGAVLSGCVVRPLGWGWVDRGGYGRGDHRQYAPERDRSGHYEHYYQREEPRRNRW